MWFSRIISSFFGIRKKTDLDKDLRNLTIHKIIILFIVLNILFGNLDVGTLFGCIEISFDMELLLIVMSCLSCLD